MVEPAGRGGQSGPPFIEIANNPDRTRPTLQAWLTDPHPPMPNLNLTNKEINDVIAYIESLRGKM
jgi:cytochrome c1